MLAFDSSIYNFSITIWTFFFIKCSLLFVLKWLIIDFSISSMFSSSHNNLTDYTLNSIIPSNNIDLGVGVSLDTQIAAEFPPHFHHTRWSNIDYGY